MWQRFENLNPSSAILTDVCSKTFAVAEPRPGLRTLFRGDCQQGDWQFVAPFTVSASELIYVDGFLLAFNPDFWQSSDDGLSWQRIEAVGTVTIPPFKGADNNWYLQSSNGLFRFDPVAKTWQSLGLAAFPDTVEQLLRFGVNSQGDVLALVYLKELERFERKWQVLSFATGESWQPYTPTQVTFDSEGNRFYPMTLHLSPDDQVWVGAQFDFLKRFDAPSQQWRTFDKSVTGLLSEVGLGVLQMLFAAEGIYVLTGEPQIGSAGLLLTSDNGESWQDLSAELGGWQKYPMKHMQFDAAGRLNVFAGAFGFYQLDVNTQKWSSLDATKPIQVDYVFRLPGDSILALARGEGWGPFASYGIWRSDNNGLSWYAAERGLIDKAGSFKGVTQNTQGHVFVSLYSGSAVNTVSGQELYQYLPETNEWRMVSRNVGQFSTLGSITSYQNTIIGGAYFDGSWQYDLASSQWRHIKEGLPARRGGEIYSGLTNLLSTDRGVFALALDQEANDGVYFKPHASQTWQRVVSQPAHISSLHFLSDNRVLGVAYHYQSNAWVAKNYVTADSGATWQVLDERIQGAVIAYAQSVDGKTQAFLSVDRQSYIDKFTFYKLDSVSGDFMAYPVPEHVRPTSLIFTSSKELLVFSTRGYLNLDISFNVIGSDIKLTADRVIEGDLYLQAGELDLNGFTLTITGNLFQSGGVVRVNGGHLKVLKDYKIIAENAASLGQLIMVNDDDYVQVGGDFVMDSAMSHENLLTAGVLEIAGNFYQENTAETSLSRFNFAASGSHTVRLTGVAPIVSFASFWQSSHFWNLSVHDFEQINFLTSYFVKGNELRWLSVYHNGVSSVVSSMDGYINCGSRCIKDYPVNSQITLYAIPASGFRFVEWQGACSGAVAECVVTLAQGLTVSVVFESLYVNVNLTSTNGVLLPYVSQNIIKGDSLVIKVMAKQGFTLLTDVSGTCPAGRWLDAENYLTGQIYTDCTVFFNASKTKKRKKLPIWLLINKD